MDTNPLKADRAPLGTVRCSEHKGNAKLDAEKVRAIRRALRYQSQAKVAALFGISQTTVSQIATGDIWSCVEGS